MYRTPFTSLCLSLSQSKLWYQAVLRQLYATPTFKQGAKGLVLAIAPRDKLWRKSSIIVRHSYSSYSSSLGTPNTKFCLKACVAWLDLKYRKHFSIHKCGSDAFQVDWRRIHSWRSAFFLAVKKMVWIWTATPKPFSSQRNPPKFRNGSLSLSKRIILGTRCQKCALVRDVCSLVIVRGFKLHEGILMAPHDIYIQMRVGLHLRENQQHFLNKSQACYHNVLIQHSWWSL